MRVNGLCHMETRDENIKFFNEFQEEVRVTENDNCYE